MNFENEVINTEETEEENKIECSCCGELFDECDMTELPYHEFICNDCLENNYISCCECGEIIPIDESIYHRGDSYCSDCFGENFTYCEYCGEEVPNDEYNWDYECCDECYEREFGLIGQYHSHEYEFIGRADPKKNIYHKGIELEIDGNDDNIALASKLRDIFNSDIEHIYFEHDGSLNTGFEIISNAHTFNEFYKIDWEKLLNTCREYGYYSHDSGTCGLHIHYSREFFGKDENTQAYNIGKLIAFYELNFEDILKFSRRTYDQYTHWADRYYTINYKTCSEIGKSKNHSRYHAINLSNYYTVEFRLGRGTLNYNSFMAWNDFHDTLIRNVKKATYKNINDLSVWLKGLKKETKEYLKSRGCFISICE